MLDNISTTYTYLVLFISNVLSFENTGSRGQHPTGGAIVDQVSANEGREICSTAKWLELPNQASCLRWAFSG